MAYNSSLFLFFQVLAAWALIQSTSSAPLNVAIENVSNPASSGAPNASVILIARQDEDDENDDDDEDETRKRIQQGVGNIILGAFSLDPNRIIQGAFGFADNDIQDNILKVILGQKPPGSADKDTRTKTTESPGSTSGNVESRTTQPPLTQRTNAPIRSQEKTKAPVAPTTANPPTTRRRVRKTTVALPEDDEEADQRY